jgi:fluoroquinolone transport system permease protein
VAAKGVSLSLLTLGSGLIVVAVSTRGHLDILRQLLALALCSAVAVLMGLACVARAASMNHLVLTLLWVSTVLYLPLLAHFGIVSGPASATLTPIPSYAMLVMLTSALEPQSVPAAIQLAATAYLGVWVSGGSWWAVRAFQRSIVTEGR